MKQEALTAVRTTMLVYRRTWPKRLARLVSWPLAADDRAREIDDESKGASDSSSTHSYREPRDPDYDSPIAAFFLYFRKNPWF